MKKNGENIMAMTKITSTEMRKYTKKNRNKLNAMYNEANPVNEDIPVKRIARGFALFKEHINYKGRPKVNDKTVPISIRLPLSIVEMLKSNEKYTQILSKYIIDGIKKGYIDFSKQSKKNQT